jgi:hypothetical protein
LKAAGLLDPVDDAYDEIVAHDARDDAEDRDTESATLENPEESA